MTCLLAIGHLLTVWNVIIGSARDHLLSLDKAQDRVELKVNFSLSYRFLQVGNSCLSWQRNIYTEGLLPVKREI
jgi:hypothetical protein